MLVIHPKDRTTLVLSTLYDGMEATVISGDCSKTEVGHLLHHISTQERIMLLGHGSDDGLFYRKDDAKSGFDKIIVGNPHVYYLRKHGGNLIGIWCYADMFARAKGLHGLFSGMIISEVKEAEENEIAATQKDILASNTAMFTKLRRLLDEQTPLHEIPQKMKVLDDEHTRLSEFNYGNFYYL